ncbi:MAG: sodium-translocating pyrophosphatase [Armatimonadetes bacterium]|nr:sodium-translocating pyrophosphatase [Armatimonadota bacterium]
METRMEFTPFENAALWGVIVAAVIGLLYGYYLRRRIVRMDQGTDEMKRIARLIQDGAYAYLHRQFTTIAWMVVILFIALTLSGATAGWDIGIGRGVAFLLGAFASAFTGWMGMTLAVQGNVRCANAARKSLREALFVAFRSGGVAGMYTVGMGLLGATIIFMIFRERATEVLLGFGFGGCLLALFMRVGGGIYTKAADVGADLVGKIEAGIPEDDPRNAAVIADQVGDNVGDCAGMAADIFESYEVTLVASMILALAHASAGGTAEAMDLAKKWILFPLIVRGVGVLTSILGIMQVNLKSDQEHPMAGISRGFFWSAITSIILFFFFARYYVQDLRLFYATTGGVILALVIYKVTEYYTSGRFRPVQEIARSTQTGTATALLQGLAVGFEGTVWSLIVICAAMFASLLIFGGEGESAVSVLYGVSLTGLGMLTTTGVMVSMDTYGPVADNAQGISEMAGTSEEAGPVLASLDAVGNTTKAATKGFAIASAVVAAVSLYGSYLSKVALAQVGGGGGGGEIISPEALERLHIQVDQPAVFIGLLIGGAMPFLFSSMTIRAVGRAAFYIINEVRRQFREIPGLMEGQAEPDSARVVDICTASALRELAAPGMLAILAPVVVGSWFGWPALGGYLAGIIVTGQLLAVFMCDAGAAWDNAKKSIEDGLYGGKGSDAHKAGVVGDTVGDPLKDTAGPALNPLIKVMNLVGLLVVPLIVRAEGSPFLPIVGIILAAVIAIFYLMSKRESQEQIQVYASVGDKQE